MLVIMEAGQRVWEGPIYLFSFLGIFENLYNEKNQYIR